MASCYYEKFCGKTDVCIDDDIPFELPKNWQWCRLNELGDTNIGLIYHPKDLTDTGIPVLRSHNIQDEKLCLSDLTRVQTKIFENQYVSNGNILICTRNGSKNLVGKCTIIENLPEKMAFGAFMAVFRSKFNPYILRYLQSFYFKDYLRKSNSTQIYQLTQNMLRDALIPVPPISEQKRIVAKIEEIFSALDNIQNNLV
ncbi:restriction endonuclease subunit S [Treponema sp. Marseille-Q4130]|uniref:restriction endonuclease subunit S n=1 Tax=Treponema sp. Marseille-Q4130 TaxID=2766702 RepID=UPI00165299AD|nr:restriction endonuclease subunit S [Treponema sp. Marseille-Q4130]